MTLFDLGAQSGPVIWYVIPDPDQDSDNRVTLPPDPDASAAQEPDLLGSDSEEDEDHF